MDDELKRLLGVLFRAWDTGCAVPADAMIARHVRARFEALTAPPSPPAPESDVMADIEAIICPEMGENGGA